MGFDEPFSQERLPNQCLTLKGNHGCLDDSAPICVARLMCLSGHAAREMNASQPSGILSHDVLDQWTSPCFRVASDSDNTGEVRSGSPYQCSS